MLLIEFKCRCGRRFRARANLACGKGICPHCKSAVKVPHFGKRVEESPLDELEVAVDPPSSSTPRASLIGPHAHNAAHDSKPGRNDRSGDSTRNDSARRSFSEPLASNMYEEIQIKVEHRGRSLCERYLPLHAQVDRSSDSRVVARLDPSDLATLLDLLACGWEIFGADMGQSDVPNGILSIRRHGIFVSATPKPKWPDDIDEDQMGGAWWNV